MVTEMLHDRGSNVAGRPSDARAEQALGGPGADGSPRIGTPKRDSVTLPIYRSAEKERDAAYTEGVMTIVPLMPVDPHGTVLGDEVYTAIGEAILDGRLAPGEHLRDQELARWLGVSRTPVREALQRLERTGLVEVSPNRFTRVTQPDTGLVEETPEFVALLLGDIVRLAVTRCSDDTLTEILDQIDTVIEGSRTDDRLGLIDASAE